MRTIKRDGQSWEIPDAFYRISAKVFIRDESNRLLVVEDTIHHAWEVPGGGVEAGESATEAAKREITEELGVELLHIDNHPSIITFAVHPDNYPTCMLYFNGTIASKNFDLESKFNAKYVTKSEFQSLIMLSDEAPIQLHMATIWPN